MDLDLAGRIANTRLPLSHGLHPLFEAVSNSMHAIEEAKEANGRIEIEVVRDAPPPSLLDGTDALQPVCGFAVHDNGAGFTDANFKSFGTSDSTRKLTKGGKGVGRFLWLKAFDRVVVESVFRSGAAHRRRTFEFRLGEGGVENMQVADAPDPARRTTVRLVGFKADYRKHPTCPRSAGTIARRVVEHFLEAFVLDTCPRITLRDDAEGADLDLNRLFAEEMRLDVLTEDFAARGHPFRISHVRLAAPQDAPHALVFCGHARAVRDEPLPRLLPNLEAALAEPAGDRRFVYAGYVTGRPLDDTVNPERTRFHLADQTADTLFAGELAWQDILDAAVARAAAYLEPFTRPLNEAKKERINKFVATQAPQYRPILKHKPDRIDRLRSNLTDEQLDVAMYQIGQEWDLELRAEYRKLLADDDAHATSQEEFRRRYERFLEGWNEAGVAKLARYVVHRKATLELLDDRRGRAADGRYPLESAIHEIVFPLKKTTDDVRVENSNLWIIDETLAYHHFLASDKPLSQVAEVIEVDSPDRPDLLIFNRPLAFADAGPPFSAIVIVEFKRPARDDYSGREDKNPISQVYDYIDLLKAGKAKDRRGVPINLPPQLPVYAYIVCDLTPTFQKQARDYQLTKTPDSQGYFGYHKEYGAYIEVISFDKLIDEAKRRNRILFDKMGLQGEAPPAC